jgi:phospholipid transport system transporter-binding protein
MTNIIQQANQWHVSGDVLMDNANTILSERQAVDRVGDLEVDFSAVTDVDTAALSLVMEWQRRALASNCKISFANMPENLNSLAALYGVADFIPSGKS